MVEAKKWDIWPNVRDKKEGVVTENRLLNPGQPEGKVVRHVVIGLDGIEFRAGDVCGVVPVNDPKQIDHLLQVLKIDGNQKVNLGKGKDGQDEIVTASELFKRKIEIVRTTERFFALLEAQEKSGKLHAREIHLLTNALGDKALREGLEETAIADLIEYFGIESVTVEDLVTTGKKLSPRLYTASSSPLADPNKVNMTVARVDRKVKLGDHIIPYRGVATGDMDGWEQGHQTTFFMQAKHKFRLPEELDKPIVMIGPGTGIAPFRAFVQEIEVSGKPHKDVVLYSGGQYKVDKLYNAEFQKAYEKGVLTEPVHYAISREGHKQRVQQLLKQDEVSIRHLVDQGALFYICGSKQMGEEVIATLKAIAPQLEADAKDRIKEDTY